MDDINESIAQAVQTGRPNHESAHQLTARDCMTKAHISFHPEQTVHDVVGIFLEKKITGGPVVSEDGKLLGMISESDCLQALASAVYDNEPFERGRLVGDTMTHKCITVDASADIYSMIRLLREHRIRGLPVLDDGAVIGLVDRADLLRTLQQLT